MGKKKKEVRERDKGKWPLREASNAALWFFFLDCGGVLWLHLWASTTWEEAALASTEKRGWKWVGSWGDPSFLDIFVFKILKTWPKLSFFFPFLFFELFGSWKSFVFFFIIIVCRDGDILFFNSFYLSLKKKKNFFFLQDRGEYFEWYSDTCVNKAIFNF